MGLQAYGVCPGCAELYPASRGCPNCDGDVEAAAHMHTARVAHVVGARQDELQRHTIGGKQSKIGRSALIAAFGISVVVGSLLLAALQA